MSKDKPLTCTIEVIFKGESSPILQSAFRCWMEREGSGLFLKELKTHSLASAYQGLLIDPEHITFETDQHTKIFFSFIPQPEWGGIKHEQV